MINYHNANQLYNNYPIDLLEEMIIDAAKHHKKSVDLAWNDYDQHAMPTNLENNFKNALNYFENLGFICNQLDGFQADNIKLDHLLIISW